MVIRNVELDDIQHSRAQLSQTELNACNNTETIKSWIAESVTTPSQIFFAVHRIENECQLPANVFDFEYLSPPVSGA